MARISWNSQHLKKIAIRWSWKYHCAIYQLLLHYPIRDNYATFVNKRKTIIKSTEVGFAIRDGRTIPKNLDRDWRLLDKASKRSSALFNMLNVALIRDYCIRPTSGTGSSERSKDPVLYKTALQIWSTLFLMPCPIISWTVQTIKSALPW